MRSIREYASINLCQVPTPIIQAKKLSEKLGIKNLLIKREDLLAGPYGGTKLRGLEFLLADAQQKNCDLVITGAGKRSNYLQMLSHACNGIGLDALMWAYGSPPEQWNGNYLMMKLMNADIRFTNDPVRSSVDVAIVDSMEEMREAGRRPYLIPRSGACGLGGLGYYKLAIELIEQIEKGQFEVDHVFCSVGSCGIISGLLAGFVHHAPRFKTWGITVSRSKQDCQQQIEGLLDELGSLLEKPFQDPFSKIELVDDFIGDGYGVMSEAGARAISCAAKYEGLWLDPVFTGKAMAGLMGLIQDGVIKKHESVLFLQTGGSVEIFDSPYHSELQRVINNEH